MNLFGTKKAAPKEDPLKRILDLKEKIDEIDKR